MQSLHSVIKCFFQQRWPLWGATNRKTKWNWVFSLLDIGKRETPVQVKCEMDGSNRQRDRSQNRNSIKLKNEFLPWNETAKVDRKLPKAKLASFELKSWIVTFAHWISNEPHWRRTVANDFYNFAGALSRRQISFDCCCFARDAINSVRPQPITNFVCISWIHASHCDTYRTQK